MFHFSFFIYNIYIGFTFRYGIHLYICSQSVRLPSYLTKPQYCNIGASVLIYSLCTREEFFFSIPCLSRVETYPPTPQPPHTTPFYLFPHRDTFPHVHPTLGQIYSCSTHIGTSFLMFTPHWYIFPPPPTSHHRDSSQIF